LIKLSSGYVEVKCIFLINFTRYLANSCHKCTETTWGVWNYHYFI